MGWTEGAGVSCSVALHITYLSAQSLTLPHPTTWRWTPGMKLKMFLGAHSAQEESLLLEILPRCLVILPEKLSTLP